MQNTLDIHYRRKLLLPFLALICLIMIGTGWHIYFSGNVDNELFKWLYLPFMLLPLYSLYPVALRVLRNKPALTFTKEELLIYVNRRHSSIHWSDVQDVSLSTDDGTTYIDFLLTTGKQKIGANWLEQSPDELMDLINEYLPVAGGDREGR